MAKSFMTPWQQLMNCFDCGATLAELIELSFAAANEKQAVMMQDEMDIKAQIAKLEATSISQKKAWAQSGGMQSKTQRTASLRSEFTATMAAIKNKNVQLVKRVNERAMNEILLQQCHDAVEAEKSKDSALVRLYNRVVSTDAVDAAHDDRMRNIDASTELKHVIDDHTQEIRHALDQVVDSSIDDDVLESLSMYQTEYDEEQVREFDCGLLDIQGDIQVVATTSSIAQEKRSLMSSRPQSIDVDIDTT